MRVGSPAKIDKGHKKNSIFESFRLSLSPLLVMMIMLKRLSLTRGKNVKIGLKKCQIMIKSESERRPKAKQGLPCVDSKPIG